MEVRRKRSYTKVLGGSRYQDKLDIGAGTKEYQGAGRQVQDNGRDQVQVQDDGGRGIRGRDIVVGVNLEDMTGGVAKINQYHP